MKNDLKIVNAEIKSKLTKNKNFVWRIFGINSQLICSISPVQDFIKILNFPASHLGYPIYGFSSFHSSKMVKLVLEAFNGQRAAGRGKIVEMGNLGWWQRNLKERIKRQRLKRLFRKKLGTLYEGELVLLGKRCNFMESRKSFYFQTFFKIIFTG